MSENSSHSKADVDAPVVESDTDISIAQVSKRRGGADDNDNPVPVAGGSSAPVADDDGAAAGGSGSSSGQKRSALKRELAEARTAAVVALPVLDEASLATVVATLRDKHSELFRLPAAPTSLPLWWQLGTQDYSVVATDNRAHALIGSSGSGKTRAMYELLTKRVGFYWTCSAYRNGGASLVERAIDQLETVSDAAVVDRAVDRLLMIFAVLFLAWREINPAGTALDWLVFQTTNVGLSDVLPPNERGNIGRAVDSVEALLKFDVCRESVNVALAAMRRKTSLNSIVVVVDEAQKLASLTAVFASSRPGAPNRAVLSRWARRLQSYSDSGVVWWLSGTSLSLSRVNDIAASAISKNDGGPDFVRLTPLAFEDYDAFAGYMTTNVTAFKFDEVTLLELFDMFRGRARPVANLAGLLRALPSTATHDDVLNVANALRANLLDPLCETSFTAHILARLDAATYAKHIHQFHTVLGLLLRGVPGEIAKTIERCMDLFEAGIGHLRSADDNKCVVAEPLAMMALFVAFCVRDPDGQNALNPVLSPLHAMVLNFHNSSILGFLAEQLVAPVIHRFFMNNNAKLLGGVRAMTPLPVYTLLHRDRIDEALVQNVPVDGLFAPKAQAHPDSIHTLRSEFGLLGQVKFTRDPLSADDWAHAVRTTSKDALFMVDANPALGVIRGFDDERNAALAAMDKKWRIGYASYVFTLAEPPAGVEFKQRLADGRLLFVFSPKLCPNLFEELKGVDVWAVLRKIKLPQRPRVSVTVATINDILAIKPDFVTATKAIAYRAELVGKGVPANELWGQITKRFWSLKKFERPDWLVD